MKLQTLIVILSVFIAGILADTYEERLAKKCIEESNADPTLVESSLRGQSVNDSKVKCFKACVMKERGVMASNGNVDKGRIIKNIPSGSSENQRKKFTDCLDRSTNGQGRDSCETAHLIFNCIGDFKKGSR